MMQLIAIIWSEYAIIRLRANAIELFGEITVMETNYKPYKHLALFVGICTLLLLSLAAQAKTVSVGRDGQPLLNLPPANQLEAAPGSNCFSSHAGVGCDDAACEASICAIDSFCCNVAWDSICANEAIDICPIDADAGDRATFTVRKDFTDDNPAQVTVSINCNTGIPLSQSQAATEGADVTFVVTSFDDGQLDCTVSEAPVSGYTAVYDDLAGGTDGPEGCVYEDVNLGQRFLCNITNSPDPVGVTINKDWIIDGEGGDEVDPDYTLTLHCEDEIVGGSSNGDWSIQFENETGTNDAAYTADVIPDWDGGTACSVEEDFFDDSVEVNTSDCIGLHVAIASGDSCTVTNTVFFEGIPALNQYALAILALLILGVGFVGFRRFV